MFSIPSNIINAILLIAGLTINFDLLGQNNLIRNGDFSELEYCRDNSRKLNGVKYWRAVTKGPVYSMFPCLGNVPESHCGEQYPKSGSGYLAVYTINVNPHSINARMYLGQTLQHELLAGATYSLEFSISLGERSSIAHDMIGAYFSKKIIDEYDEEWIIFHYPPQVTSPPGKIITEMEEWITVSGEFVAEGGETDIIFGAFGPNESFVIKEFESAPWEEKSNVAMYFIDDIKLFLLDSGNYQYERGEIITLDNILFELSSHKLKSRYLTQLDQLAVFLKENQEIQITITGYTDSTGSAKYNLNLSLARANSIEKYLVKKGIERQRIMTNGQGSNNPVAGNNSEAGRMKNRRVEILIN